jgi:hypothetical protein
MLILWEVSNKNLVFVGRSKSKVTLRDIRDSGDHRGSTGYYAPRPPATRLPRTLT